MVCVRDFHDLCSRLSLQGSFGESWHNGIWSLLMKNVDNISTKQRGGIKSGVSRSENSTISQAVRAGALSCRKM